MSTLAAAFGLPPIRFNPANWAPRPHWNPVTRVAFRFAFAYLLIYGFTAALGLLPLGGFVAMWVEEGWHAVVVPVGQWLFHQKITIFPGGSGDTTYNYVQVFCFAVLAAVVALLWSALDWRRASYPWLWDALRVYVRFVLAAALLGYGINKLFKLQFPDPAVTRLLQQYGDSSPMGLLWTFMGASDPYTRFGGAMEAIGGILLCFRRTTLLGAAVAAGVMTNVVMMNLCYDVPVKLYSSHLLLMSGFLMLPDLRRMVDVFVLNRPAAPADLGPPYRAAWLRWTLFGVKMLFVSVLVLQMVYGNMQMQQTYGDGAPKGAMDGTWEVTQMSVDGVAMPALADDAAQWRYLTIYDRPMQRFFVATHWKGPNDVWALEVTPNQGAASEPDAGARATGMLTLSLQQGRMGAAAPAAEGAAPAPLGELRFTDAGDGTLRLEGKVAGKQMVLQGKRKEAKDFLLMSRGFHWINEFPFNR